MRQLLDVVHQGVQLPLAVHLGLAAQREAVELLVVTQIGEHRLHRGEAPAVFGAALCAVDALLHLLGVNVFAEMLAFALAHKEGHLTHLGFFGGA